MDSGRAGIGFQGPGVGLVVGGGRRGDRVGRDGWAAMACCGRARMSSSSRGTPAAAVCSSASRVRVSRSVSAPVVARRGRAPAAGAGSGSGRQSLSRARGAEGLDDAALDLRGRDRGERLGQVGRGRGGKGQAAERVVYEVQLTLARGQLGGLGVQQFRVGEVVGAVLGRGRALCGQVLDGVLELLRLLLAPRVRGRGVGADGLAGLGQMRGAVRRGRGR